MGFQVPLPRPWQGHQQPTPGKAFEKLPRGLAPGLPEAPGLLGVHLAEGLVEFVRLC